MTQVKISYYSDVLCIWAYITHRRLEQMVEEFGDRISIENHFCSVFPDAWSKIENTWRDKGGFSGFNHHLKEVAREFPHIEIDDSLWLDTRPRTSANAHLFLKAIEIIERDQLAGDGEKIPYMQRLSTRATWALRHSFFALARDISNWQVQSEIAVQLGLDPAQVAEKTRSSEAFALLAADYDLSQKRGVEGSPTFIMNNGRQKLFGNVGYRLLQANIQELIRHPGQDEASWC